MNGASRRAHSRCCNAGKQPRRLVTFLLSAALLTCTSCDGGVQVPGPLHRFVTAPPGQATNSTTIDDDTRDSLAAPALVPLLFGPQTVPAGARFQFRSSLPTALREARRLLLLPVARIADEWAELPSIVVDVEDNGDQAFVAYDVPVPGAAPGSATIVSVRAIDVSGGSASEHSTAAITIPAKSGLRFATGLLGRPASGRGTFTVEACRGADCRNVYRREIDAAKPEERRWNDASIDLASFAGDGVSFVFRGESTDAEGKPAGVPVWGNPVVTGSRVVPRRPPNILLVSIDTLGAKHLPSYGYEFDTAPFLSEVAASGVLFERCIAAATHTLESHMTMMTGLPAADHGVHAHPDVLDPRVPTLAEHLRRHGFATAAFTEDAWIGASFGFARGFDVFRENRSADLMNPEGYIATTFNQGLGWLEGRDDTPFFLFLHSYQVHHPHVPPEAYGTMFRPEGTLGLPGYEADKLHYDQEIRYADDELRRLWKRVEELGHGDDTILVVTSDHGEAFLEHGWLRHGSYLYDEVVRVPLIVRGPGIVAGARIAGNVGGGDLFPTLAELAGTPLPRSGRGMSLAPVLRDPRLSGGLGERVVTSETWAPVAFASGLQKLPFPNPAFAAVQANRKLARYPLADGGARYEYYDLWNDPEEGDDLWERRSAEVDDLKALLDQWQERGVRAQQSRKNGETSAAEDDAGDPALEEKLRALGYLN